MILNNRNYVYVTDGQMSLTEHFAREQYVYPRRIYEGMEFYADLDTLTSECNWLQKEFGITLRRLTDLYCPSGSTYISSVPSEAGSLFQKLWEAFDLPVSFGLSQMKIYTLALFSLLLNQKETDSKIPGMYLLYRDTGRYCQAGRKDHHLGSPPAPSCMGTGCTIFSQRNKSEKLFPWCVRTEYLCLSAGSTHEKSSQSAYQNPLTSRRDCRAGRLPESE